VIQKSFCGAAAAVVVAAERWCSSAVVVLDVVRCNGRSAVQWFSWCSGCCAVRCGAVIDAVVVAVLIIGPVAVAQFNGGSPCAVQWFLYNLAV
jgi:hypothetical protein